MNFSKNPNLNQDLIKPMTVKRSTNLNQNPEVINRFGYAGQVFGDQNRNTTANSENLLKISLLSNLGHLEKIESKNFPYTLYDFTKFDEKCNDLFDSTFIFVGSINCVETRDEKYSIFYNFTNVIMLNSQSVKFCLIINLTKRKFEFIKVSIQEPIRNSVNDAHLVEKIDNSLIRIQSSGSNIQQNYRRISTLIENENGSDTIEYEFVSETEEKINNKFMEISKYLGRQTLVGGLRFGTLSSPDTKIHYNLGKFDTILGLNEFLDYNCYNKDIISKYGFSIWFEKLKSDLQFDINKGDSEHKWIKVGEKYNTFGHWNHKENLRDYTIGQLVTDKILILADQSQSNRNKIGFTINLRRGTQFCVSKMYERIYIVQKKENTIEEGTELKIISFQEIYLELLRREIIKN